MSTRDIPKAYVKGQDKDLAFIIADVKEMEAGSSTYVLRAFQTSRAHLLTVLGMRLYSRATARHVFVAVDGDRVATFCFRRSTDSGSLQLVYDSGKEIGYEVTEEDLEGEDDEVTEVPC